LCRSCRVEDIGRADRPELRMAIGSSQGSIACQALRLKSKVLTPALAPARARATALAPALSLAPTLALAPARAPALSLARALARALAPALAPAPTRATALAPAPSPARALAPARALKSTYGGVRGGVTRVWGGVARDNRHACNHRRLARAPRLGLPGLRPQAQPASYASRAVRHSPVSRRPAPRDALPRTQLLRHLSEADDATSKRVLEGGSPAKDRVGFVHP